MTVKVRCDCGMNVGIPCVACGNTYLEGEPDEIKKVKEFLVKENELSREKANIRKQNA